MENQTNCPCCGNHCSKDDLQCGRGKRYFAEGGNEQSLGKGHAHGAPFENADEEPAVTMLRRCGHLLHHGGADNLLGPLTAEEKQTLCDLLGKCLK